MNDTETIQRARGWRWYGASDGKMCVGRRWFSPVSGGEFGSIHEVLASCGDAHDPPWPVARDPLADTPEGWYEFGQILKWAHERGWRYCVLTDPADGEQAIQFFKLSDPILLPKYFGWTGPDFRAAIIAALAAAVRPESEAKG